MTGNREDETHPTSGLEPGVDPTPTPHAPLLPAKAVPLPPPSAPSRPSNRRARAALRLPVVPREAYQILAEHARGAIGRILRAKDNRLGRIVAIKELRVEHGKEEERFVREALLTARLEHPSIVPVHEAGRWPTGEPFIAMKLVVGRSLDDLLKETPVLEQRVVLLRHVLLVAEAIAYAHSVGIIHRDLKPANVLVGSFGETVVIDWGLAKDMQGEPDQGSQEHTPTYRRGIPIVETEEGLTMLGEVMGTPAYMPPEQARGFPVDERADVYALGAILYHVLSGAPPYEGPPTAVVRMVVHDLPVPLERRQKGIPPDLLALVKKAMARSPTERYRTAKELADDLRNYTSGAVVRAHTYTTTDRAVRLLRRHKPVALVVAAAAVLLLGIGIYAVRRVVTEADRAAEKQREAETAQEEATQRADDLVLAEAKTALDRDPNQAVARLKRLSPRFTRWSAVRLVAADAEQRGISHVLKGHTAAVHRGVFLPDGTLLTAGDDRSLRLWSSANGGARTLEGAAASVWDVDVSSLGTVVTGGRDGAVRTWNVSTGENHLAAQHGQGVVRVAITRDGRFVVSRGKSEHVRVTDLKSGLSSNATDSPSEDSDLALSPDGRRIAFVALNRLHVRWLEEGTEKVHPSPGHLVRCSAFSPDGAALATGTVDGLIRVWDLQKGSYRDWTGHTGTVVALAYTPSGMLVSASVDRTVRLWDGKEARVLRGHDGDISSMRLSPDGAHAVTASADHTIRIWDLDGGESEVLRGMGDVVSGAAFSPDGTRVAGWGWDQTVRIWTLSDRGTRVLATYDSAATRVAFASADVVASAGGDKTVQIARTGGGRPIVLKQLSAVLDLAGAKGVIAAAEADGAIHLFGLDGRELHILRGHTGPVRRVVFSPDGSRLASASADRSVQVWDVTSGQRPRMYEHDGEVKVLAFSPDGKRLASGGTDRSVRVWSLDSPSGQTWTGHAGEILGLAFSPDGQTLVSAGADRTIARWDGSGRAKFIDTAGGSVSRIAFLKGGALFATAGADPALRMWDTRSGESRAVMRGHAGQIVDVAVSPDGRRVATVSTDTTMRLWDLEAGASRVLALHGDAVTAVSYSPDGRWIATASTDRTVRLWADTLPDDGPGLRAWIDSRDVDAR